MKRNSPLGPAARSLIALIAISLPAQALTLFFVRVTDNADDDIAGDIALEVTDLGAQMALFELSRGDTFAGFLRNVYFEGPDTTVLGASFDPVHSSANVMFDDPSDPAHPPGIAGFVTAYSFDADSPNPPSHSVGPDQTGAFQVNYAGSYDDFETAIVEGTVRVAVHAQGLDDAANESDSFVSVVPVDPLPEPSVAIFLVLGSLLPLRRRR
ncbi:hypothetical protein [Haloferula rosea]|uniref:PEP-CTERM sorting domain-containing protein n=1 Tax=Haloferula rosea TaxID=490093 RepID=A0A934VA22_9BACT|nr:hypothetical protein [Haloferula rosea]MBK1825843.1 hypothetical protein [Haloferula rosea]